MIDQRSKYYTQTAISYGLPFRLISYKYMLRNAMIPTVAFIAALYPVSLGSAVLVEAVFSWPGLGRLAFSSVDDNDFPVMVGLMLLFTFMFLVVNLLTDVLYAYVDPRIRYG